MHRRRHLRTWDAVHRWTSLLCTVFLLLLCLTGLPLIFHDEISRSTQPPIEVDRLARPADRASLDRVVEAAVAQHPTLHPLFASHEPREPRIWYVTLGGVDTLAQVAVDARSAAVLSQPHVGLQGIMRIILSLHVDLFSGLKGKLFMGAMGLLFLVSLLSGAVLYAPFMRRRHFGAIRANSGARSRWLDLHNLWGIATLLWASVIGLTGVINACSDVLLAQWRSTLLAQYGAPQTSALTRPPAVRASMQAVMTEAMSRLRERDIAFIAFPGSSFAGDDLYGVYTRGTTPLTSRLVRPILLDAATARVVSEQALPWYLTVLLLSEPLHFGDYGGLPLKLLWAALDGVTILVSGTGVYLLLARKRRPSGARAGFDSPGHGSV